MAASAKSSGSQQYSGCPHQSAENGGRLYGTNQQRRNPRRITEEARGDFNEINSSINTCIDAVNRLIEDTGELVYAAVHGRLDQRADSSLHGGDFAKIIDGVNKTIDTLVGHIDALPSPVMIINKDFEIQYVNNAGAELAGRVREELSGIKCYDVFRTRDCNTENCACLRAMDRPK
jgi:methyl-accepting chemotaxis protein